MGLRVGVRNGGCAGMSYTMELAERVEPLDEVIEDKGVKVLIDPKAVLFLLGAEMDFKSTGSARRSVPQPERDLVLRLRRERRHHASRSGALERRRAADGRRGAEGAVRAVRRR